MLDGGFDDDEEDDDLEASMDPLNQVDLKVVYI